MSEKSRTSSILRDSEESYGWGTTEYLLAAVANAVREGTFVNMQVRTKKKLDSPDQITVPGAATKKKKPKANRFVQLAQAQLAKQQRSI